ncbi:hypothetical protein [Bradyrhizobium sp. G127]|jgi:hypothetical protein|uniref:hypothetical protein n=1 Tax=Bradyrhizobium sp. G127 TaxID=2904800 RepID=UPI001F40866C|nr:hypothetical protein [Bradyrhizobium sp. G127]MCF2522634.1 hypothetical protein [Bradyrhizobium sp. G127]
MALLGNLRAFGLLILLICLGVASRPSYAQWWKLYTPKDFEECSQSAEQPGLSQDAKAKIISECDFKFTGRRKAGGGYTYFDFTQNRHFDIAGPNPTQQELKRMDQEYLTYLETSRETSIDAVDAGQAIAAINSQIRPITDQKTAESKAPAKQPVAGRVGGRKSAVCKNDALACGWKKITTTVRDLRQALLGPDGRLRAQPKL